MPLSVFWVLIFGASVDSMQQSSKSRLCLLFSAHNCTFPFHGFIIFHSDYTTLLSGYNLSIDFDSLKQTAAKLC